MKTKAETQHTPTPWKLEGQDIVADGRIVAIAGTSVDDLHKANAAFIVRAVNSHEALLDACKGMVRSVSMNQYWKELPGAIKVNVAKCVEAIAKAEAV